MADSDKSLEGSIGGVECEDDSLALSVYTGDRFGDYILEAELGQGGMGTVWKARHFQITNLYVAIKFVTQSIGRSPELLERFKNEILTVSNIRHPNIINILTCDWEKNPPFYVMDFVSGKDGKAQDLAAIIAAGEIPLDNIRQWMLQAAGALEAAHNKNVIHRDIKPANILIDADGNVKVCDFGLAKQQVGEDRHLSKTGVFIGTLSYASPEQKRGEKVDARTDIFSLGYVLYELLTGEQPSSLSPSEIRDGLPEEWDNLYKKMVHPKLERRFQTMGEVITALQNINDASRDKVSGEPVIPPVALSTQPPLMIRGNLALEESDWGNAVKYFDSVLNELPTYAPAYAGLLCAELKMHNEDALGDYKESISSNKNFQKALRFADADYKAKLEGYEEKIEAAAVERYRGEIAESKGKMKEAIDMFKQSKLPASDKMRETVNSINAVFKNLDGKTSGELREVKGTLQRYLDTFRGEQAKAEETRRQQLEAERLAADLKIAGRRQVLKIAGVDFAFRWCPAGDFLMGSPSGEKDRSANETQHQVTLTRDFYMGETAVTQEQWKAVIGKNPSNFKGANLPVENVSWNNCQEFIKKLNGFGVAPTGFKFSLPTEAQWEYACRAGTTTPFSCSMLNGDKANCNGNYPYGTATKGKYLKKTAAVGSYPANAWGLYDMHGNVWEWCNDWYGDYPTGSVTDPTGTTGGSFRVRRGGGWDCYARSCRSAYRGYFAPWCPNFTLGLRLSLVSESK